MYRLIYQDGDSPQNYTFSVGEVVIGRSPECQVVLKDFGISRQHAKIVVDEDGARILDLKSKNGTTVNGRAKVTGFTESPSVTGSFHNPEVRLQGAIAGMPFTFEGKLVNASQIDGRLSGPVTLSTTLRKSQ